MNDRGEVCSEEAGEDGTLEHPTAGLGDSKEVFILCHLVEKKGGDEGKYSSNDNSHSKDYQESVFLLPCAPTHSDLLFSPIDHCGKTCGDGLASVGLVGRNGRWGNTVKKEASARE